jgi:hypothetical protein
MTVASVAVPKYYNGDGTTTGFSFPYLTLENAHAIVVLIDSNDTPTTQVLDTDYTVTGAGDEAGITVTMTTAPASGEQLVIWRDTPLTQGTDYVTGDAFPAETHEAALDKVVLMIQESLVDFNRSWHSSVESTENTTLELDPQALALIGWSSDGLSLINVSRSELTGVNYAPIHNIGTVTTGTETLERDNGSYQRYVNNGAHTLAPPNDVSSGYGSFMIVHVTNGASAGAITTSGFTLVDGDTLTTTENDEFMFYITPLNIGGTDISHLTVVALQ